MNDMAAVRESKPVSVPSTIDSSSKRPQSTLPDGIATVLRNAAASTMGAGVVATVVTPLDVVKVRLQAHVCPVGGHNPCVDPRHVDNSLDALRKIVRADGLKGLWRGLNATLVLAIPTTGLYFTLYEAFRERLQSDHPHWSAATAPLIAGAAARATAASAASPLELARTTLQAGVAGEGATVTSVLRDLRKEHGIRAWWRGLGPTLLRDAPFSAIYWSSYEILKHPTRSPLPQRAFASGNELPLYVSSGIGAGSLAALCTVPADVIKTRRQAPTSIGTSPTRRGSVPSSFEMVREIISTDGLRGLFRGAGPRIAKVAPACAIMMGSFETFRRFLGDVSENSSNA